MTRQNVEMEGDPLQGLPDEAEAPDINTAEFNPGDPIPTDIEDFLLANGITGHAYNFYLYRAPLEGGRPEQMPCSDKNKFPSPDEIGRKFGGGRYFYRFTWRAKDPLNPDRRSPKPFMKEIKVTLSEDWNEIAELHQAELRAKNMEKIQKTNFQARQRMNMYVDPNMPNPEDPIAALGKTVKALESVGIKVGGNGGGGDMAATLTAIMSAQSESQKMMMGMMQMQNQNMMQLLLATMTRKEEKPQNELFEEYRNMMRSVMDMKAELSPAQKTVADRIFDVLEGVAPAFLQMARMPAPVRNAAVKPMLKAVQSNKDYQALLNDPEILGALVDKWDAAHGPANTDTILATVGIRRPNAVRTVAPAAPDPEPIEPELPEIPEDENEEGAPPDPALPDSDAPFGE